MSRKRRSNRFRVALIICLVIGEIEAFALSGVTGSMSSALGPVAGVFITALLGVLLGVATWFFPYAIVVLGVTKLFDQKKEAVEALGDENVVHDDPDGERKLHEYLTAITSMEARIGLLQRSDTYIPPEVRAPEGVKPSRAILSRRGWWILKGIVIAGVLGGVFTGYMNGLGNGGPGGLAIFQLFAAGMVGAVLSAPVAVLFALVLGGIDGDDQPPQPKNEENHDTGAGGPETA